MFPFKSNLNKDPPTVFSSNESIQPGDGSLLVSDETEDMLCVLAELRESGLFCDVTIKLDNGSQFKAHRAVLSMSSPFFRALFTNGITPGEVHLIPGISFDTMKLVLQYCYTRRCRIDETTVEQLLPAADRLFMTSLKERCSDFLSSQLHVKNCIGLRRLARFYYCNDLVRQVDRFLLKNFLTVATTTDEWLQLTAEELVELCQYDDLNCKSEEQVFSAVFRWLSHDQTRQRLERVVTDVFQTVRIGLLPLQFLKEVTFNNRLIKNNQLLLRMFTNQIRVRTLKQKITADDLDQTHYSTRLRIPNEILVAVGGWTGRHPNDVIEVFDSRADRWRIFDNSLDNGPRAYHSGVSVTGQEIYLIGGYNGSEYFNSVRLWNMATNTWQEKAPMNCRRCYVASVALPNNKILALGGFDGTVRQNTAEIYDPPSNQWSYTSPMNLQRSDAGAAVLNGRVYVCGGFSGQECLNSVEVYDPATDQWALVAPMNSRRSGVCVVAYRGSLYAIGGFNGRKRVESVDRYIVDENVWRPVASMHIARSNFAVGVIDDLLYVIGGYNGSHTINHVEYYDSLADKWTETTPLNTNRSALSVVVLSDLPNVIDYIRPDSISSAHNLTSSSY